MKKMKIEDFGAELLKLAKEAITGIEKGVNECAEDLLSESQQLAPLDTGELMGSGNVEPAKKTGGTIKAKVGYNKVYALRRHEDFYTAKIAGRGRKYLEKPLTDNSQKYVDHIADRMNGD